jgi:LPS sulfotransferase NodH
MIRTRAYIVCATPRSGSTLLCQLLDSTGVAGHPEEYFEARAATGLPPHPREYLEGLTGVEGHVLDDLAPPEPADYSDLRAIARYGEHLARSFARGTTPNGVFGSKLMWSNLEDLHALVRGLPEYADVDPRDLLEVVFGKPRYVWMTRADKRRQAISLWRAMQTHKWRLAHPGDATDPQLHYSYAAIDHLRGRLGEDDRRWEEYLAARPADTLRVAYEDELDIEQAATIERVLLHLGLRLPEGWVPPVRTYRQADDLNHEWLERYEADAAQALQAPSG